MNKSGFVERSTYNHVVGELTDELAEKASRIAELEAELQVSRAANFRYVMNANTLGAELAKARGLLKRTLPHMASNNWHDAADTYSDVEAYLGECACMAGCKDCVKKEETT